MTIYTRPKLVRKKKNIKTIFIIKYLQTKREISDIYITEKKKEDKNNKAFSKQQLKQQK